MIIKTKLFVLRLFKKGDEESLVENINNKSIYERTLRIPYPYTMQDAWDWIAKNEVEDPTGVSFAIDINGQVVGGIGIARIENNEGELGYWLGEHYWGQGIMSEAVKRITEYGFQNLGLEKLYADVFSFNNASMKVLEKNGYSLEGIHRGDVTKDGKLIDGHRFAKYSKKTT